MSDRAAVVAIADTQMVFHATFIDVFAICLRIGYLTPNCDTRLFETKH
jgi:hypothetical protein